MIRATAQPLRLPGRPARLISQALGPRVTWIIFSLAGRVHRWEIAPFPRSGGVILACNHISHFDPPIIGTWCRRNVDWMAMEELFQNPLSARVLGLLGAFPVDRQGTDRLAIRTAMRRLAEGNVVGIFPEGGIRAGAGSILEGAPMRPGVAALSVMAHAPVVPCVIFGSDRLYRLANWLPVRRVAVWMVFGEMIQPDDCQNRDEARAEVQARLGAAFPELQARAVEHFHLKPDDLPDTPQARKGEDPHAPTE